MPIALLLVIWFSVSISHLDKLVVAPLEVIRIHIPPTFLKREISLQLNSKYFQSYALHQSCLVHLAPVVGCNPGFNLLHSSTVSPPSPDHSFDLQHYAACPFPLLLASRLDLRFCLNMSQAGLP